jgi:hypothetical protein
MASAFALLLLLIVFSAFMWGMGFGQFFSDMEIMENWRRMRSGRQSPHQPPPRSITPNPRSHSKRSSSSRSPSPSSGKRSSPKPQPWDVEDYKALQLRDRLLKLLYGDRAALDGLIASARKKKPLMGELWYLEKVLSDLERDRFR